MNRKGFTLTELAIVLGVVGVMLGAVWSAGSMARQHMKIAQATGEVAVISQNIRNLFPPGHQFKPAR